MQMIIFKYSRLKKKDDIVGKHHSIFVKRTIKIQMNTKSFGKN